MERRARERVSRDTLLYSHAREEIKTGEKKRKGIAGEKRWREEKDYRKTEIQRKIPGKFTISKEGVL